jgi:hypothetical protein
MEVLLVGQADSIFFEHYTKTIKKQRPDINFNVFSVDAIQGKYDLSACNLVHINSWVESPYRKIKGVRTILQPFITWLSLYIFLKRNKKRYDIIHFKWLIPGVILFPNIIRKYTIKTIATFWGSEMESQNLLFSKNLYVITLNNFLRKCNVVANRSKKVEEYISNELNAKQKFHKAHYGSSIIDEIQKLSKSETKEESKGKIGINGKLITIAIGYSGKTLHQHILVLEEIFKSEKFNNLKEKFHFILPLNYGCSMEYAQHVELKIKMYTDKFTIINPGKYTDVEIARLRNATDILIQLSKSDGLSASIIESFYAGSIIISGKWLPYEVLRKAELYFYELDNIDENLPEMLLKLSKNFDYEIDLCLQNKTRWSYDSWGKVIPNWLDIYDKVLQEA